MSAMFQSRAFAALEMRMEKPRVCSMHRRMVVLSNAVSLLAALCSLVIRTACGSTAKHLELQQRTEHSLRL